LGFYEWDRHDNGNRKRCGGRRGRGWRSDDEIIALNRWCLFLRLFWCRRKFGGRLCLLMRQQIAGLWVRLGLVVEFRDGFNMAVG
jgi:hypothetical protein